jgi:hypothetical protein
MLMRTVVAQGVQWLFPREFRIDPGSGGDLEAAIREIAAALRVLSALPPPGAEKKPEVETGFIIALCNDLYRIRRNNRLLAQGGADNKEIRTIGRAIERLDRVLRDKEIEYFDLEGRQWDDRHLDFDFLPPPEEVAGLMFKRIGPCECPLVKIHGKIVQRARGILQVPVRSATAGSGPAENLAQKPESDRPAPGRETESGEKQP